jgi:two-component system phosphate regulon response regulator PhoB
MNKKILIVDDESAIREMVCFALQRADFDCVEAADVPEARIKVADNPPDMILLDWMMPGTSGIDYARQVRKDELTRHIPVIMLTARSEEGDKIKGLEIGADDYLTKPFSPRELIARIKAVLRRVSPEVDEDILEWEGLKLNNASHRVTIGDIHLDVGPTEYRLLHFFLTHPERVFSRGQILDRVWGSNVYIDERTVDVHIRRLRKLLAEYGYDKYIQTVRSAGYRFSKQE